MSLSESDGKMTPHLTRKRKSNGRIGDVNKKLRVQSHEIGDDCRYKRYKCFSVNSGDERNILINNFNLLERSHLAGLMFILPIKSRRPLKSDDEANLRDSSFQYKVRIRRSLKEKFQCVLRHLCLYMELEEDEEEEEEEEDELRQYRSH